MDDLSETAVSRHRDDTEAPPGDDPLELNGGGGGGGGQGAEAQRELLPVEGAIISPSADGNYHNGQVMCVLWRSSKTS